LAAQLVAIPFAVSLLFYGSLTRLPHAASSRWIARR
jgi:hypothetical protein